MAEYVNQFPTKLLVGDRVTLTATGTYNLPHNFSALVEVIAGAGGQGGNATWTYGYVYTGAGGGAGGKATFEWAFTAALQLLATIGTNGGKGSTADVPYSGDYEWHVGQYRGGTGGVGGNTILKIDGITIAQANGGQGGQGALVVASRSDQMPSGSNGTVFGANGTVPTIPAGGTKGTGSPPSIIITVLSVNQPPTAPSYIEYSTPRAGKPLTIAIGEATDPD